jgi:hypothetical protein
MKMRTFAFDFQRTKEIFVCATKRAAINLGNGLVLAQDSSDLVDARISIDQMVNFYNTHNTTNQIKGFRDRKTAAERLLALAEAKAKLIRSADQQENEMQNAAVKKADDRDDARKGRISSFTGKTIFLSPGITANPRREGTHGFKSMEIIMKAKNGLSYDDFVRQGGRRQDLVWDIAHGNVVVR